MEPTPEAPYNGTALGVVMWLIEESGDEEFGYTWNIMLADGDRAKCVAQCLDEHLAEQIVSALKWVDALGSGMMKLSMDGITINATTGLVWRRDPRQRSYDIKTEKRPTKKPRQ